MTVTLERPRNDEIYGWRRAFAWFPLHVAMNRVPVPDAIALRHAYSAGDDEFTRLKIWWEAYEWRFTGRSNTLFTEVEYRLGLEIFVNWVRNGYDG